MRNILWYESIDSTMYEGARLALEGCPHGTVVVADEQTGGHGRHGRAWHSEKGAGLYATVVLRLPAVQASELPIVTLALGLAAADAIQLGCDLRWPNDVLIREKKCCGILTQLHGGAVVAGIGINVNHTEFPPEIAKLATSLRIERGGGAEIDRRVLLVRLLDSIDTHCEILQNQGSDAIMRLFSRASSYVYGRRVRLEDTGERGTTDGLDSAGFLILRKDDGRRMTVLAGGVRPE
jgi:BirA family transcriptional regulator, biotin operon repressor / biotin---[acetyl-CoA-carboxylase] ligase